VERQFVAGGYRFTRGRYGRHARLPRHRHEFPGIVIVADGALEEVFRSGTLSATAGTLLVRAHDDCHSDRFGPDGAVLIVVENVDGALDHSELSDTPAVLDARFVRVLGASLREAMNRDDKSCAIALVSDAVDLWGVAAAPRRHARPPRVTRAVELIHDDIGSIRSIDRLALAAGVHPVSLARGFRETFGCSLAGYIRRVRLARACDLLRSTAMSLAEIAGEAGFADQAHMTRGFRSRFGCTPGSLPRRW
jgi:AraC family transcriptional regulator